MTTPCTPSPTSFHIPVQQIPSLSQLNELLEKSWVPRFFGDSPPTPAPTPTIETTWPCSPSRSCPRLNLLFQPLQAFPRLEPQVERPQSLDLLINALTTQRRKQPPRQCAQKYRLSQSKPTGVTKFTSRCRPENGPISSRLRSRQKRNKIKRIYG